VKSFCPALAIMAIGFVVGCGWFGSPEAYKSESGRTTFKSAEASPSESVTPAPEKIPGDSRKGGD